MTHTCQFRVYYEDTDAGGVVYYANYLKFAERARTEFLRDLGLEQTQLAQDEDLLFVVRHAALDIKKPARLDDLVTIETSIASSGGASFIMHQKINNAEGVLAIVDVRIAAVTSQLKPKRLGKGFFERTIRA